VTDAVEFSVNGSPVAVPARGSLLDALREELGLTGAKDGCSPQGQCGCCTVWVDGQPRVACVTPVARVRGRDVTTIEGLDLADDWAGAFTRHGASQCGFCTPGIIMRAAALPEAKRTSTSAVCQSMLAHQCRCTGWQSVVAAIVDGPAGIDLGDLTHDHGVSDAEQRAQLEGRVPQSVGPAVAIGSGGFADDTAPRDALVAVRGAGGNWVVGGSLDEARQLSGKVQGRRTTAPLTWPVPVPDGDWARTLQTTWVEPGYLEPDASWCVPGGEPVSSHGNGGAFGGKQEGRLGEVARRLADEHGRPVRVLLTREDVVREGPKRPPIGAGVRPDGTGLVHVVRTPGIADAIRSVAPGFEVVEVDAVGPPTSRALRGAGWVEAAVLLASLVDEPTTTIRSPDGATASATIGDDGSIHATVGAGRVLDARILRSYCVGAAHMALGWVTSEGLAVGDDGVPHDLTMRSFGVLRAVDTPPLHVELVDGDGTPVNGSDAVFAAVATVVWRRSGWATRWPTSA
jgi:aerobic-type carbon monoxide dehydrogenase small subunit (CoxS/CutS family)